MEAVERNNVVYARIQNGEIEATCIQMGVRFNVILDTVQVKSFKEFNRELGQLCFDRLLLAVTLPKSVK